MITEEPTPSQLVRAGRELERLKALQNQKDKAQYYQQHGVQKDIPGINYLLHALRGEPGYVRPPREQGPEMPYPSSSLANAPIQGRLFTTDVNYTPTYNPRQNLIEEIAASKASQTPSGRRYAALNNIRAAGMLAAILGSGVGTAAYVSPDF